MFVIELFVTCQQNRLINACTKSETKRKNPVVKDKVLTLNAWKRVDYNTRAVLKRYFHSDILLEYEVRALILRFQSCYYPAKLQLVKYSSAKCEMAYMDSLT